jgi:hypothetical protein
MVINFYAHLQFRRVGPFIRMKISAPTVQIIRKYIWVPDEYVMTYVADINDSSLMNSS